MGKKGSWFSAIKRVFILHSKEKLGNESENRSSKEKKKKGLPKIRHGDNKSFIPLFRKPSSIEKILGDAERDHHNITFRPPSPPPSRPKTPPFVPRRVASPRIASPRAASPRAASSRAASPKVASPRASSSRIVHHHRPEPTLRYRNVSATKIQAAYRGYMARRSFRALKGLVRLQGVVRGQNVKRQTTNTMKYMQLLVRIQSQIQSRRIQMLENQARHQTLNKEVDSTLRNLTQTPEAGEEWDDSLLTKEEVDTRNQKKVEAVIKREKAMAYAYSHMSWKPNPKSALTDVRAGGFPWWWNWLERQLPAENTPDSQAVKNFKLTPPRPSPQPRLQLQSKNQKPQNFGYDNYDSLTPKSSKSTVSMPAKPARTPASSRIPPENSPRISKYFRPRVSGAYSPFDVPLRDDDSLTSCPPFSVPNYMSPTVSAKAKVRAGSNPSERFPGTPNSESKRRLSFPLTQGIGSFKWKKGSMFSNKDTSSQQGFDRPLSTQSIGNMSVDSVVSLPVGVGRKPFNRFV